MHFSSNIFSRRNLILLIHFAFVLVGIATTQLGVILPAFTKQFQLNDAQSGSLSIAHYIGSLIGTLTTNFFWRRLGFLSTLIIGLIVTAFGMGGIGFSNFWVTIAAGIFLNGVGVGLAIPTTNLLIAETYREKAASALNVLNFAWGSGALLCPAIFGLLGTQTDVRLPLFCLSIILFVIALSLGLFKEIAAKTFIKNEAIDNKLFSSAIEMWMTPFAILLATLLFFYVGVENSLGYWLTSFALRMESSENTLLSQSTIAFWAAFLMSRLLAPVWLKRLKPQHFIFGCLSIAAIGLAILLNAQKSQFVLSIATILIGFGLAPVFPTTLAQFTNRFGSSAIDQAKWLFISSTIGGAFLTWLVGYLSKTFDSLRSGLFAVLMSCLLMIIVQALLIRESKNKQC
jgi:fucose permease